MEDTEGGGDGPDNTDPALVNGISKDVPNDRYVYKQGQYFDVAVDVT